MTNIVLEIPLLVLGAFLFETFFGIPGLGSITIDALHNSDLPVIKTMSFVTSLLLIFGNILTDIVHRKTHTESCTAVPLNLQSTVQLIDEQRHQLQTQ